MPADDPKAQKFAEAVAQNASDYYEQNLKEPATLMTGALRRMTLHTGDDSYAEAADKIELEMQMLPMDATFLADKGYAAHQAYTASDGLHEPDEVESMMPKSAYQAVHAGWMKSAELAHTGDPQALAAARVVATYARMLEPLMDPDTYDEAVLDPAAEKHLK